MPERPAPGRAVVTRRAVTDIVRTAVLGVYGVAGFATPDPWGYFVRWLGLGEPGIRIGLDDLRSSSTSESPTACPSPRSPARSSRRSAMPCGATSIASRARWPSTSTVSSSATGACPPYRRPSGVRRRPKGPPARTSGIGGAAGRCRRRIGESPVTRRWCDGTGLIEALRAAVANLDAHVDEINALNVFPVPDGDTGSNMVATMLVALEQAETVAGEPAGRSPERSSAAPSTGRAATPG